MTDHVSEKMPPSMSQIAITGRMELDTVISMRYTDTLSAELVANLTSPQAIALIHKHLKDKNPAELHAGLLKPLADDIPESFLNVVRETIFHSGAAVKELQCEVPLEVGKPFRLLGSGRLGELVIRDGILTDINLAAQLYQP